MDEKKEYRLHSPLWQSLLISLGIAIFIVLMVGVLYSSVLLFRFSANPPTDAAWYSKLSIEYALFFYMLIISAALHLIFHPWRKRPERRLSIIYDSGTALVIIILIAGTLVNAADVKPWYEVLEKNPAIALPASLMPYVTPILIAGLLIMIVLTYVRTAFGLKRWRAIIDKDSLTVTDWRGRTRSVNWHDMSRITVFSVGSKWTPYVEIASDGRPVRLPKFFLPNREELIENIVSKSELEKSLDKKHAKVFTRRSDTP